VKEIRGAKAVRYAGEMNIDFDIDESYLTMKESQISGKHFAPVNVYLLLDEKLGREFDPAEVVPGSEVFEFLVNRYGENWAYVALEGSSPEVEERVTLRQFRRLLEGQVPAAWADVRELFRRYWPLRLGQTGFHRDAHLNLVFHAALRLTRKGALVSREETDPPREGQQASYGRRRFMIPADVEVPLTGVLCEQCRGKHGKTILSLHPECAARLRRSLKRAGGR
jgi:hypothetical protein